MKTTIDLPDDLVRQLKLRAVRDGRKMKDLAADLLAQALTGNARPNGPSSPLIPKTLPLIKVRPTALPSGRPLTGQDHCDFIKDVEQQHEIERHESIFGHQHVDRADR